MANFLMHRREVLQGLLNGIDSCLNTINAVDPNRDLYAFVSTAKPPKRTANDALYIYPQQQYSARTPEMASILNNQYGIPAQMPPQMPPSSLPPPLPPQSYSFPPKNPRDKPIRTSDIVVGGSTTSPDPFSGFDTSI